MGNRLMGSIVALVAVLALSAVILAQTAEQSAGAKARMAASTPDLGGVWQRTRRPPDRARRYTVFDLVYALTLEEPPMTPWAEEKFKANKPNVAPNEVPLADTNDPVSNCFPPGVPRIYLVRGEPMEIVQSPGRVIMIFEYDHFVRQIYADGRQHAKDLPPSWMGDSIGRWEGDTLVVDTVGFNDKTWLDMVGHPHSDDLHLVERIRRVNRDTLQNDITVDDPKAYVKPWGARLIFELKPDWTLGEMICEDNVNFDDLQKKSEPSK